jgi:hypothetical protein
MKIIVTKRVCIDYGHPRCHHDDSYWTWTLYDEKSDPIARAEYSWNAKSTAQKNARKFLKLIGHQEIKVVSSSLG